MDPARRFMFIGCAILSMQSQKAVTAYFSSGGYYILASQSSGILIIDSSLIPGNSRNLPNHSWYEDNDKVYHHFWKLNAMKTFVK